MEVTNSTERPFDFQLTAHRCDPEDLKSSGIPCSHSRPIEIDVSILTASMTRISSFVTEQGLP
jgi:hypothetical protein